MPPAHSARQPARRRVGIAQDEPDREGPLIPSCCRRG